MQNYSPKKRICIIGGGGSGLASAKACKEQNLDYVVYESSESLGGLWRYREDDTDGIPSVTKTTIINSSKEMTAFSDFPPDPSYPNFMHNSKFIKYLEAYAKEIGCIGNMFFQHKVIHCRQDVDFEKNGRWSVEVLDMVKNESFVEVFDGIMVCTGHHVHPLWVKFPGQEKFKGKITHTHSYKRPTGYENKTVVVVGLGNSGGDAAAELSPVAKMVYLSTRTGTWVSHRVGPFGRPLDYWFTNRFFGTIRDLMPSLSNTVIESYMNSKFDHELYRVKPKHRYMEQHLMLNDNLHNLIASGRIKIVNNIREVRENGVIFENDNKLVECDCIILATGYEIVFPFLDKSLVGISDNNVDLYKFVFNPRLGAQCHTLGFIGYVQPDGAILPCSEMHARWYASIMAGKTRLPSKQKMLQDIEEKKVYTRKHFYQAKRQTLQCYWMPHLDEIALQLGCKPNLLKYFFTDFPLWCRVIFGPSLNYQYRLEGPNKWSGAREAIFSSAYRLASPLDTRQLTTGSNGDYVKKNNNIHRIMYLAASLSMFYFYKNGLTVEPIVERAKKLNQTIAHQISQRVNLM